MSISFFLRIFLTSIIVELNFVVLYVQGFVAEQAWVHAQGRGGGWESLSLSFLKIFFSEFLSNLNRTNSNVPVFTAGQTKAAFEPSDVVMPPTPPRPGSELGWPSSIVALLPISAPGRGTRGLSHLNGLPLCHCLLVSAYSLKDIDCVTISHHVQKSLKLICHTELIGLCDGDKGRLVGHRTQKANTMYGFLNNTKAGE